MYRNEFVIVDSYFQNRYLDRGHFALLRYILQPRSFKIIYNLMISLGLHLNTTLKLRTLQSIPVSVGKSEY